MHKTYRLQIEQTRLIPTGQGANECTVSVIFIVRLHSVRNVRASQVIGVSLIVRAVLVLPAIGGGILAAAMVRLVAGGELVISGLVLGDREVW